MRSILARSTHALCKTYGRRHYPLKTATRQIIEPEYKRALSEGRMYFGKDGNAVPSRIQYLKDIDGMAPWTWWPHEEVGHTDESKKEIQALFGKNDTFDTPKPERLIERILHIATNPGDFVLDSFAGSGTTGAVAHKMGRKWIREVRDALDFGEVRDALDFVRFRGDVQ